MPRAEVMPTPQGEERRQEILARAIDVFGEFGFAGARIDEVAQRVGIRRPSVLYHFADKQKLYAAAIGDIVHDIVDRVLTVEAEPGARLEAVTDAWIDFVISRPNAARVLLRQMIDAEPIRIEDVDAPVRRLLGSIQSALDDRAGPANSKSVDATEFALILSSTSLVWVASRSAVEGAFGLDTLSPQSIQRHRRTLYALTRQMLAATTEAAEPKTARRRDPVKK